MASEPVCENGGSCVSSPPGYNCTCADGYTGTNCEAEIGKSGFHLAIITFHPDKKMVKNIDKNIKM